MPARKMLPTYSVHEILLAKGWTVMLDVNGNADKEHRPGPPAMEEGVYLNDLAVGAVIELETQHHSYTLVKETGSEAWISGHPAFCPEPVLVHIAGSVPGRSWLDAKLGFIGRGLHLAFIHPVYSTIVTSRIRQIQKVD
jgi:hypothetical protein